MNKKNNKEEDFVILKQEKKEKNKILKQFENSLQISDQTEYNTTVLEYPVSPTLLHKLAGESFIIEGIIDKVSLASNTRLIPETGKIKTEIMETIEEIKDVMISFGINNLYISGNAFFEVIRDGKGEVVELIPFITEEIRLLPGGEGAIQKVGSSEVFYNSFEPDEEKKLEKIKIWQEINGRNNNNKKLVVEEINGRKRTGFNPNGINEFILIKTPNPTNKYYGKSKIISVVDQLLLLKYIDSYFVGFFEGGTMQNQLIYNKNGNWGKEERRAFVEDLKQRVKGVDNAFNIIATNGDIGKLILNTDINPGDFSSARNDLRQDILARMNIPFELMYSQNSNRASMNTSKSNLYDHHIRGIHLLFENILNDILKTYGNSKKVKKVKFEKIDSKDATEEIKALSIAVQSGWMTPNDARLESNYELDPLLGGDELQIPKEVDITEEEKKEVIEKLKDEY